ncbi:hypothetical protein [Arenicella xantha]|uniref:FixH protein n=1 Tax=Arenicella xantha TaxID=644221 RepID=A0A395JIU4_9GAMM|nr:hypothetical protein [Arenicella xantha]RBP50696.1 hypothetical protein DFR28_102107 [Arenicella xantha]
MTSQTVAKKTLNKDQPWYRIGMVWLMISLPLIVVIASMVTVVIAYQNAPNIVHLEGQ